MFKSHRLALITAVALLFAGLLFLAHQSRERGPRQELALMTSLPIYWSNVSSFAELASGQGETPWVRAALEEDYELVPLDALAIEGPGGLADVSKLIIAQPRALSPQDNVVLDEWVSSGGQLFLIIDPLLTGDYPMPIGHPSHPVSIGLVPPVLKRWGLGIQFDEAQSLELNLATDYGIEIPIAMAGQAYLLDSGIGTCRVSNTGLLAECEVGRGQVTLLADATLFEFHSPTGDRRKSLSKLLNLAFK